MADKTPATTPSAPAGQTPTTPAAQPQAPISPASPSSTQGTGTPPQAPGQPEAAIPGNTKDTLDTTESGDPKKNVQPGAINEESAAANRTPTEARIAEQNRPLRISARAGWPFSISGSFFGDKPGTLTISGRKVDTTTWNDRSIKGTLPSDIESGEVVLKTSDGKERKGQFVRQQDAPTR